MLASGLLLPLLYAVSYVSSSPVAFEPGFDRDTVNKVETDALQISTHRFGMLRRYDVSH